MTPEDRERALAKVTYAYMLVRSLPAASRTLVALEALEAAQDALSPAEPVRDDGRSPDVVFAMECAGYMTDEAEPAPRGEESG